MAVKNGTWATPGGKRKPVRVWCPSCRWVTERVYDGDRPGGYGWCTNLIGCAAPGFLVPTPTRKAARQIVANRELKGGRL